MSEPEEARTPPLLLLPAPPPPEQHSPPPQRTVAPPQLPDPDVAYRIWPPTEPTREAIISRLVEALSSPSALSTRYGTLPLDEAVDIARAIEQESFAFTCAAFSDEDDGADVLQAYAAAIGKRMFHAVQPLTRTTRKRGSFPLSTLAE